MAQIFLECFQKSEIKFPKKAIQPKILEIPGAKSKGTEFRRRPMKFRNLSLIARFPLFQKKCTIFYSAQVPSAANRAS